MKSPSILAKFFLTNMICVSLVAAGGYYVGSAYLAQSFNFASDLKVDDALALHLKTIKDERQLRMQLAELQIRDCKTASCQLSWAYSAEASEEPEGWLDDDRYVYQGLQYTLKWGDLKADFMMIQDLLGLRRHLGELFPAISQELKVQFAWWIGAALFLGLLMNIGLSQWISRRMKKLRQYTVELGRGELKKAPFRSDDELGTLAQSLETMAFQLHEAKEKQIYNQKVESWQTIARKVAHEIKNPLTPLQLVADELGDYAQRVDQDWIKHSVKILNDEIKQLNRMVTQFSSFARLPDPEFASHDIGQVVSDFVNKHAQDPRFTIQWQPVLSLRVMCDPGMIHQVLFNLLNNARQACRDKKLCLELSLKCDDSVAKLDIRDNGPGVPEDLKARMFDAYVTTKSTWDVERGMGLGLAISRKIADQHRGQLYLLRSDASGTVFRFECPLQKGS